MGRFERSVSADAIGDGPMGSDTSRQGGRPAQSLRRKSSEDGDGATVRQFRRDQSGQNARFLAIRGGEVEPVEEEIDG